MIDVAVIFASAFISVFALGLQSLNVNQGQHWAATVTSIAISTGSLYLYQHMPKPNPAEILAYYAGCALGINAGMWIHPRVKTWWAGRRNHEGRRT